jgi:hypothetical protein
VAIAGSEQKLMRAAVKAKTSQAGGVGQRELRFVRLALNENIHPVAFAPNLDLDTPSPKGHDVAAAGGH